MHFTKADIVQAILNECPVLEIFIDFPGFFGVPFSKVESIVMLVMAGFILGWGVISIFCSIFYYKSLKQWKETVTSSTYKLQRMLFFALVAQTVNNWIFAILPLATAFIWSAERHIYSSYATMLGIFISSFHTIADIVATLYFIRPYRACIMKFIRRLFTKFIRVHPTPQVANLGILPSNIHFSNQSEYARVARLMRDQ
uniref:Uncharacterized protein n=1 Tax=Acrobeloides nanus TaxID=290746 RepID=A0A914DVU3_9BILA